MVLIMGMIFFLSHQPYDFPQLPQLTGADKFAHIIAYGFLAAGFLYGVQPFAGKRNYGAIAVIVVLFCILYGITDEFHQSFIPGRFVSVWDVAADGLGGLLVAGYWYLKRTKAAAAEYS